MKIKYLKKAPRGMPGDIAEVPDHQAMVLIKLGVAENFSEGSEVKQTIEFLKNLNGTPVVDDFGALVDASKVEVGKIPTPVENTTKAEPKQPKTPRVSKTK